MSDSDKEQDSGSTASIPPLLLEDGDHSDGSMYKYRDFSQIPDQDDDTSSEPPASQSSRGGGGGGGSLESSIRVQKFPVKLYAILAQKEFQDIITWMPHGRAWKVLKPNLFESLVMPLFFEYSNYHSFNRLVNAWSFRRISSGPDRGSYYHELFLRGKPHLQKYMRRLPKTHKKLPMKKEDEPDFYGLDKSNPLPTLEECPVPASTLMAMRQPQAVGMMQNMQQVPSMQQVQSMQNMPNMQNGPSMHNVSPPPTPPTQQNGYNGFYPPKGPVANENFAPQMDGRMNGMRNGMGGRQMGGPPPQYGGPHQMQQQQQHPRNVGIEPVNYHPHHQQGPPMDNMGVNQCGPPPPPSNMGQHGEYPSPPTPPNGGGQQAQLYHYQRMQQYQQMQMYDRAPPQAMMGRGPHGPPSHHGGPPQQQMVSHGPIMGDGGHNMMRMQPNGIPGGRS